MSKNGIMATLGITALVVLIGGGGAYGYYTYFDTSYKEKYSFEEINTDVFTYQKILAQKLEQYIKKETYDLTQGIETSGNIQMHLSAKTPFGSGSFDLDIPEYSASIKDKNYDAKTKNLSIKMQGIPPGSPNQETMNFSEFHFINNLEGAYLQSGEITYTEGLGKLLGVDTQALFMTLNNLGKGKKYIEMGKGNNNLLPFGLLGSYPYKQQIGKDLFSYYLEVLKNEPVFEVQKQEGTKYYFVPSKRMCKVKKMHTEHRKTQSEKALKAIKNSKPIGANELESDIVVYDKNRIDSSPDCTDEEYNKFVEEILSDDDMKVILYMEKSKVKKHIVMDGISPDFQVQGEVTANLIGLEYAKFSAIPNGVKMTGSGILIEGIDKKISGYIHLEEIEKGTKTDITLSPAGENTVKIAGTYSTKNVGKVIPSAGFIRLSSNAVGDISGELSPNRASLLLNIKTQTTGTGETTNSQNTVSIDFGVENTSYSGAIELKSHIENSVDKMPIDSQVKFSWQYMYDTPNTKGNFSLTVDIPNMVQGDLGIQFAHITTQEVSTSFETPKEIISTKIFENFLGVNKKKLQKLQEVQMGVSQIVEK